MKIKTIRQTLGLLLMTLMIGVLAFGRTASAEEASVSFSDPSCTVGDSVSVSVKVAPAASGITIRLYYDPAFLSYEGFSGGCGNASVSGTNGAIRIFDYANSGVAEFSYSLTFKSLQTGSTKIGISEVEEITDAAGDPMTIGHLGSSAVTINPKPTQAPASSEARLSSLVLKPGSLSPAFSPDVTSYRISVPNETSAMTISFTTKDSKAKAFYWPYVNELAVGDTELTVRVTAEDEKTVKDYTIIITRASAPTPTQPKPSETQSTSAAATTPAETTEEVTTEAETTEEVTTEAESASLLCESRILTVLPLPEEQELPAGYRLKELISEDGTLYEAFEPENAEAADHLIIYGQIGEGKPGLYLFDPEEGTFQRYHFAALPTETEAEETTPEETTSEEPSSEIASEPETTVLKTSAAEPVSSPAAESTAESAPQKEGFIEKLLGAGWVPVFIICMLLIIILILILFLILGKKKQSGALAELPDEELSVEEMDELLGVSITNTLALSHKNDAAGSENTEAEAPESSEAENIEENTAESESAGNEAAADGEMQSGEKE